MALTSQSFIDIPQDTDILSDIAKSTVQSFRGTYFQGVRRFEPDQWTKNGACQKKYPSFDGTKLHH